MRVGGDVRIKVRPLVLMRNGAATSLWRGNLWPITIIRVSVTFFFTLAD